MVAAHLEEVVDALSEHENVVVELSTQGAVGVHPPTWKKRADRHSVVFVRVPDDAMNAIDAFCERRLDCGARPARARRRGTSVTINHRQRPYYDTDEEWLSMPIAQLRFDPASARWTLFWKRASGRWEPYVGGEPTRFLKRLLNEIDSGPWCVFFG